MAAVKAIPVTQPKPVVAPSRQGIGAEQDGRSDGYGARPKRARAKGRQAERESEALVMSVSRRARMRTHRVRHRPPRLAALCHHTRPATLGAADPGCSGSRLHGTAHSPREASRKIPHGRPPVSRSVMHGAAAGFMEKRYAAFKLEWGGLAAPLRHLAHRAPASATRAHIAGSAPFVSQPMSEPCIMASTCSGVGDCASLLLRQSGEHFVSAG